MGAMPQLNGCVGLCEEWHPADGRWSVILEDGTVKRVRPDNLHPSLLKIGMAVCIHGLLSAPHLNGQSGICTEWDPLDGRWHIKMTAGDLKKVKPENLEPAPLQPGIQVRLRCLKAAPHLNGMSGVCEEWHAADKRWTVALEGGAEKKMV